ncbi:uncharacterized protein LOC120477735 [Pimephales promelas]|uniref:uncharacterized protein LOC120477735 n=1 Tax=Pimephales promelas TaxID=90988 RepID=UPI00195581C7|nr:uncharacterized protein LOC120477735 [Pimephales promelas]
MGSVPPSLSESGFYSHYFSHTQEKRGSQIYILIYNLRQNSHEKTVQNPYDQTTPCARSPEGLVYLSRSERCLFSDSYNTLSQAILEILWRSGLSIQRPAVRPVFSTPYIHEVHANFQPSGRLADSGAVRDRDIISQSSAPQSSTGPRAHYCELDSVAMTARLSTQRARVFPEGQQHSSEDIPEDGGLHGFSCCGTSAGVAAHAPSATLAGRSWAHLAWESGCERIRVTQSCITALQPWLVANWYQRGVIKGTVSYQKFISTDASNLGLGALFEYRPVFGLWSDQEKLHYMNCLKPIAVENALKRFLPFMF